MASKCCMAEYCIYSDDGVYCDAVDELVEKCPYLNAIGKIAELCAELSLKE